MIAAAIVQALSPPIPFGRRPKQRDRSNPSAMPHSSRGGYATPNMLAFVMFFSQPRTPAGDAEMQTMTRERVDALLEARGDTTCLTACIRPPGSFAAHIRKPN